MPPVKIPKRRATREELTLAGKVFPSQKALQAEKYRLRVAFELKQDLTEEEEPIARQLYEEYEEKVKAGRERAKGKIAESSKKTHEFIREFNDRMKVWKQEYEKRPGESTYQWTLRKGAYIYNNPQRFSTFRKKEDCKEPEIVPWEYSPDGIVYAIITFHDWDGPDVRHLYLLSPHGKVYETHISPDRVRNPIENFVTPYTTHQENNPEAWEAWSQETRRGAMLIPQ